MKKEEEEGKIKRGFGDGVEGDFCFCKRQT